MGVSHVICVNKSAMIYDLACIEFSSLFYQELLKFKGSKEGCAICFAFEKAKNYVKYTEETWEKESEKFQILTRKNSDGSCNSLQYANLA